MSTDQKPISPTKAAQLLGCTQATVLNLIHAGQIPAFKVGRHYRVYPADVEAYITASRVTPKTGDESVVAK